MLRCRPLAERSSADRRPKPRATGHEKSLALRVASESLWEFFFPNQTTSYDEICSFCLHRFRSLNGKIKNLQNTRESSSRTVVHQLLLVTKTFKTSCLRKRREWLVFIFWFFVAIPLLEKIVTVELLCAMISHKRQSIQNS